MWPFCMYLVEICTCIILFPHPTFPSGQGLAELEERELVFLVQLRKEEGAQMFFVVSLEVLFVDRDVFSNDASYVVVVARCNRPRTCRLTVAGVHFMDINS